MNKVLEIHDSNLYGVIVEAGCGTALTSELLSEAGASKTLYNALIPYSKEYSKHRYGYDDRSVSSKFVKKALEVESEIFNRETNVNFIFASTWQLNDGDPKKYIHGWVGMKKRNDEKIDYLHFSFSRKSFVSVSRQDIIQKIGEQCINVIYARLHEENFIELVNGVCLDESYHNDLKGNYIINYDMLINTLEKCEWDYPLYFSGTLGLKSNDRFEELMRSSDEFIIQKGSFNPIHHKHLDIMKISKENFPKAKEVFLISTYRYDKPHIDVPELIERINRITDLGYRVIILKSIYFYDTFKLFMHWSDESKKFYFPIGTDIINRIIKTDLDNSKDIYNRFINKLNMNIHLYKNNFKFLLFHRLGYDLIEEAVLYAPLLNHINNYVDDGVSSTKIRAGYIKNELD